MRTINRSKRSSFIPAVRLGSDSADRPAGRARYSVGALHLGAWAQIGKWHTGTDAGFGRDWDYQIIWNRPAHPDNAGKYYCNQLLTFNGEDRLTEGYSTDNYTSWVVEYMHGQHRTRQENRGTYSFVMVRFTGRRSLPNVIKETPEPPSACHVIT